MHRPEDEFHQQMRACPYARDYQRNAPLRQCSRAAARPTPPGNAVVVYVGPAISPARASVTYGYRVSQSLAGLRGDYTDHGARTHCGARGTINLILLPSLSLAHKTRAFGHGVVHAKGHAGGEGTARPVRGRFVSGPAHDCALLISPLVDARRARRHGGGRRGASEGGRNSLLRGGPWLSKPVRTRYVQEVNTIACGGAFQWEWMRFVAVARVRNKEVEVAFDRISSFRHSKSCSPQLGRRCIG